MNFTIESLFSTAYKSKTEVRLPRIKSFNLIQKAKVRYTPNHKPAVTKVM